MAGVEREDTNESGWDGRVSSETAKPKTHVEHLSVDLESKKALGVNHQNLQADEPQNIEEGRLEN